MSANDEFPRGWTIGNAYTPGPVVFQVPAAAGITRAIDEIVATLYSTNPAAAAASVIVQAVSVLEGANSFVDIGTLVLSGGTIAKDIVSESGLGLVSDPGAVITVQFNVNIPANYAATLLVKGHDK